LGLPIIQNITYFGLSVKDRPTYGNVGTVNQADPKDVPVTLIRITKVGFVWFRK
jgi:hypothetical protein